MSLSDTKPTGRTTGHTLVEVVVAIAITSILLVGMASALLIASRAANPVGPTNTVLATSMAAHDILGELRFAIAFTERTATAVEFTVADRTGDEVPETIRYAWSGTAGDPLTRRYNGGTVANVVENVQEFQLDYDLRTVSQVQHIAGTGISLRAGQDATTRVDGAVGVLNQPEVPEP